MPPPVRILVGIIGAPQGLKGEVRIKSLTADPLALKDYGPVQDEAGARGWRVLALRLIRDDMCVARLEGVEDRDAAQALNPTKLYALRANLPAPAAGEYYHADLIGLRAETRAGLAFGTIVAIHNFGAGDLLEIAPPNGGETVLLPFASPFLGEVDVTRGRVTVDPPPDEDAAPE